MWDGMQPFSAKVSKESLRHAFVNGLRDFMWRLSVFNDWTIIFDLSFNYSSRVRLERVSPHDFHDLALEDILISWA